MGTLASGAKVVSRIICYAGWVLPINMQLLMSITYCVQSILPGAVGMQRKASTVYNPQISIHCSLLLTCSYFTMQADMPGWSICVGGVMVRRQGRCHIGAGKKGEGGQERTSQP